MRTAPRRRFWVEAGLAAVAAVTLILTVLRPDWIEAVSGLEPDGGNATVEWLITGALLTVACAAGLLAGHEWRRVAA